MSESRPFSSSSFKPPGPQKPKTVRRKTTRRIAGATAEEGAAPAPPPPKKNPLALAFGIGGGVLALLILLALAFGGGSRTVRAAAATARPRPKPKAAAPAGDTRPVRTRINTNEGAILFICAGDDKHPEREVLLDHCACGVKSRFQWDYDASQYRCQGCKAVYAQAKIACPACGKVPRVHRIKYGG